MAGLMASSRRLARALAASMAIVVVLISGFSVVLFSSTSPAEAVRRTACMTDHFHYGSSSGQSSEKVARREAIANWQGFTAFEYGNAWASFKRARSQRVSCAKSEAGWGCNVEGSGI